MSSLIWGEGSALVQGAGSSLTTEALIAQGLVRSVITHRSGIPEVNERSTHVFDVALYDENSSVVLPESLVWSLTTHTGVIINNREDVSVSGPSFLNPIVVSGDDLAIDPTEDGSLFVHRKLIVEVTFTSTLGTGLPLTGVVPFVVRNLPKIT